MWKQVNINIQNIKHETGKAVLINCPHNSDYDGYSFWMPSKLIRNGKHSYAVSLSYTDDFKFVLKKYGKGKFNSKDVLDEIEISVKDFEEMFGVMNDNITEKLNPYETHKPEPIEPTEVEVNDELKR